MLEELCLFPNVIAVTGKVTAADRLTSLSNRVYRVQAENGQFILRLPKPETAHFVNRFDECHNLALAAQVGVAVAPLLCDPEQAILLMKAVPEMSGRVLPAALGALIARLHKSGCMFRGQLHPEKLCRQRLQSFPTHMRHDELYAMLAELADKLPGGTAYDFVPGHGDLSDRNCLVTDAGPLLIDFEFSAMMPPQWDLAYAILENAYSVREEDEFLQAYQSMGGHFVCSQALLQMKILCDVISALWALEQQGAGAEQDQMREFALLRTKRATGHADQLGVSAEG